MQDNPRFSVWLESLEEFETLVDTLTRLPHKWLRLNALVRHLSHKRELFPLGVSCGYFEDLELGYHRTYNYTKDKCGEELTLDEFLHKYHCGAPSRLKDISQLVNMVADFW